MKKIFYFCALLLIFILILTLIFFLKKVSTKYNYNNDNDNNNSINILPIDYKSNEHRIPTHLINKKYMYYNPSLIKIKNQKYIWIRKSAYFLCMPGRTMSGNVNQHIFAKLSDDNELILESQVNMILPANADIYKNHEITKNSVETKYYGVEDIRLTYDKNRDIIILSGSYNYKKNHRFHVLLYYAEFNYHNYTILYETLFPDIYNRRFLKNLIPLYKNNNLYFIYSLFPYILTKPNFKNNTLSIVKKQDYELPFKLKKNTMLSGGSNALPLGDFYLGIGHIKYYKPKIFYKHFFYLLDKECNVIAYTKNNFSIGNKDLVIQFACGLIFDKDQLLVSYGENDCYSKLIYYKFSDIFKNMSPINKSSCNLKIGIDRPQFCILGFFNLLLTVSYILKEANIIYWIDYGTLLGAVRGNYIIRYTNDVDLSILDKDKNKAIKVLKSLENYVRVSEKIDRNHTWIYCDSGIIDNISLDIALRVKHNNKLYDGSIKDCTNPINIKDIFPLSEVYIYGFKFPAPRNSKNVLKIYYGEDFLKEDRFKHAD